MYKQGKYMGYTIANISHVVFFFFPQVLDKDVQKPVWQTEIILLSQDHMLPGVNQDWGYWVSRFLIMYQLTEDENYLKALFLYVFLLRKRKNP